jgi:hypothetical protein
VHEKVVWLLTSRRCLGGEPRLAQVVDAGSEERAFNMLAASSNFVLLFPIFLMSRLA